MMKRTENENHLLDIFCRWGQMTPKERNVRLEGVVNAVLNEAKEAKQDGYSFDYHETKGLRLFTPGGLILWFVPATNEQRMEVFIVDLSV
jgi:hypothetical protein